MMGLCAKDNDFDGAANKLNEEQVDSAGPK